MPATAAQECPAPNPYGICRACGKGHGYKVQLHPTDPMNKTKSTNYHAVRSAEIRDADIPQRLHDARENLAYWLRQKHARTDPKAKAQAGALVLAWTATRDSLLSQIKALNPQH